MADQVQLYKMVLDQHFNVETMVESRLVRLRVPADVEVLYADKTLTVPVTYVGTLESLMQVAHAQGVDDPEEFDGLVTKL